MKNYLRLLAAAAVIGCFAFASPKSGESDKITVVIDAAHGGKDFGAAHGAFLEKEITQKIAEKIQSLNKDKDVELHFTRTSDEFVSLDDRITAINKIKPDLVVSLHLNAGKTPETKGMEFFVCRESAQYEKAAHHAKKLAESFAHKRYAIDGVKEARFLLLRKSDVPAVHFEMGYLTNEADRLYLTSETGQEEIAHVVLDYITGIK